MALLGKAAIAMWWDMAAPWRAEFEDWHSHEHFPERMGIPGFLRGSRWADASGGEGFFVMYELDRYETLVSDGYLSRLNQPTPWSSRLMPEHRGMVRSQCQVLESAGSALGRYLLTVRCSPASGGAAALRDYLRVQAEALATQPGTTGAHLLQTQTPDIAATTEQKIRGGDQAADWIYLVCGYDRRALEASLAGALAPALLQAHGAAGAHLAQVFTLCHSAENLQRAGIAAERQA